MRKRLRWKSADARAHGKGPPPSAGQAPAHMRKFRAPDLAGEEFAVAPERDRNQRAPEEDGEVAGVHRGKKSGNTEKLKAET